MLGAPPPLPATADSGNTTVHWLAAHEAPATRKAQSQTYAGNTHPPEVSKHNPNDTHTTYTRNIAAKPTPETYAARPRRNIPRHASRQRPACAGSSGMLLSMHFPAVQVHSRVATVTPERGLCVPWLDLGVTRRRHALHPSGRETRSGSTCAGRPVRSAGARDSAHARPQRRRPWSPCPPS